jgi:hypothetical protein
MHPDKEHKLELLAQCTFPMLDKATWELGEDGERLYLQVKWWGHNSETGAREWCIGRKWFLSPHMTNSEVVQTAFAAVMAVMEHETREFFQYKGQPIFCPHYDVEILVALHRRGSCQDVRPL